MPAGCVAGAAGHVSRIPGAAAGLAAVTAGDARGPAHALRRAAGGLGWCGARHEERGRHARQLRRGPLHGPVVDVPDVHRVLLAGGRVAAFCRAAVQLFDVDTGARLGSFDVYRYSYYHAHAVCDRWIPFAEGDGRVLLLDCVVARLIQIAPVGDTQGFAQFSVAGLYISFRASDTVDIAVAHISGGPNGATVVREVARACFVALTDTAPQRRGEASASASSLTSPTLLSRNSTGPSIIWRFP